MGGTNQQDLKKLLRGFNFLEQLALLTQSRRVPPVVPLEQRRTLHSSAAASRFAPQPKLFLDVNEDPDHNRAVRTQPGADATYNLPSSSQEDVMWVPDQRWSKRRSWGGLSRLPGFKRSVFREAARDEQRGYGIGSKMGESGLTSVAAILGAEADQGENLITRAAM